MIQQTHRWKDDRTCCSLEDVENARATAFKLDIPFYVLNMKDLFRERVVDYFVDAYLAGDTLIPVLPVIVI